MQTKVKKRARPVPQNTTRKLVVLTALLFHQVSGSRTVASLQKTSKFAHIRPIASGVGKHAKPVKMASYARRRQANQLLGISVAQEDPTAQVAFKPNAQLDMQVFESVLHLRLMAAFNVQQASTAPKAPLISSSPHAHAVPTVPKVKPWWSALKELTMTT